MANRISRIVTRVTINASIVPRSHSRAITSAVSSAPLKVMIIAMRPGTRKSRLFTAGLNRTRGCKAIGSGAGRPASAACATSQPAQTCWT